VLTSRPHWFYTRILRVPKCFSPQTFTLAPKSAHRSGVKALKNYLSFAKDGHFEVGDVTAREPDSEFERWVIQMLREAGYEVVPQVGVAGYFIDLAVRHPDRTGAFILGVECDGAMYHSARSVRDRDRLRQEILERLNWNIYRIWSTDWFRNPRVEFKKLVDRIEELRLDKK
jgi:very-short-patch-repair endonuclease